ncbi:MAG: type II secretion system F family protein [Bacteroidota bacterium]
MPEFRIEGLTPAERPVSGIINADSLGLAKQRAQALAKEKRFRIIRVVGRSTFLYRVRRGDEKAITGEQKAFTKEEVRDALQKMGYKVLSVNRKLLDFKPKPPASEIITFVRVSADLMRQKLPFNEIMQLLINDVQNKTLRDTIRDINQELKQGRDSELVFKKYENVLGKFTANMLGLASKSGNMAEIYDSAAKFLERQQDFKKNLKSALIMPLVTLFVLFLAVVFYVGYVFPATAELFVRFKIDLPPMTKATLKMSDFITENIIFLIIIMVAPVIIAARFFSTDKGRFILDRYVIRIPVMGPLLHKQSIEIFCRVFYALYSGSGENIDVIKMAAEACGNKYMEHQIKSIAIPLMIEKGTNLTEAFEATAVFTKTALSRFHSGAETGTVKHTALQLAEYYEKETSYKLKNAIEFIQLSVSMLIMVVLTALTLVSSETATVRPKAGTTGMGSNQEIHRVDRPLV